MSRDRNSTGNPLPIATGYRTGVSMCKQHRKPKIVTLSLIANCSHRPVVHHASSGSLSSSWSSQTTSGISP